MTGKRMILGWAFLVFIAISGIVIGRLSVTSASTEGEDYEILKTFTEVMSMVKKHYVEEVNGQDLVYGAIRGMLHSLDPHSSFMNPDAYKEMQVDTKGEFGGLGIQIGIKDAVLTVIAPIEDTPAYRAGIKAGDKIIKIEEEITKDMTLYEAVSKMRGKPKTSITIGILREGWKEIKDFTIVRDIIKIKSVKSKVIEDDIGYIKISQFQEKTARDVSKALESVTKKGVSSLILDLRNNPGGLLNSAIDVSDRFLPKGKLVVYTKNREGQKTEFFTEDDSDSSLPMIVLVNQGSASASEIVAGALKDWNKAIILGTETFGKGSVQTVIPLSDGAGLRLTTAKYYTPKGEDIQNTGIIPTITVKLQAANGAKEHAIIREKDLKGHLENDNNNADSAETSETEKAPLVVDEEDDNQLRRAIDLLKSWDVFKKLPKAS